MILQTIPERGLEGNRGEVMGPEDQLAELVKMFDEANRGFVSRRRRKDLARGVEAAGRTLGSFTSGYQEAIELAAAWVPMKPVVNRNGTGWYHPYTATSSPTADVYAWASRRCLGYKICMSYRTLTDGRLAFMTAEVSRSGTVQTLAITSTLFALFEQSYRRWATDPADEIESFVRRSSDFFGEFASVGHFAAVQAGLLTPDGGKLLISHAGNDIVHVWRMQQSEIESVQLPSVPAAGAIPPDFMGAIGEDPYPYTTTEIPLSPGDILLCMTNGFEQSLRDCAGLVSPEEIEALRRPNASNLGSNALQDVSYHQFDHSVKEYLWARDRIIPCVTAALSGSEYHLPRFRDPVPSELMTFDFRDQPSTPRTASLAAAACEFVFRLRPPGDATDDDSVEIDTELDDFLRATFSGYVHFFSRPAPAGGQGDVRYNRYIGVRSDRDNHDSAILTIGIKPDAEIERFPHPLNESVGDLKELTLDDIEPLTDLTEHSHTSNDDALEELPVVEDEQGDDRPARELPAVEDAPGGTPPPGRFPNGYDDDLDELPSIDD